MISRLVKYDLSKQSNFFVFLKDFIRDPIRIGAISESSNTMARAMVDNLIINPGDPVMELGPGTGAFTQQIYKKTNVYLGIERNQRFIQILDRRFPDLHFVNGLAEDGYHHYQEKGLPPPKVIICGLPLSIWSDELQDAVIDVLKNLMKVDCIFRTFQYAHSFAFPSAIRFRRRMDALYGPHHRSQLVLRNVPPAFILTWYQE